MKHDPIVNELAALKRIIEFLWDGNNEAFGILYFIKSNYKEWPAIVKWLKDNNVKGQKLVELFQNESPDGGGVHMGVTYILSRLKGHKHNLKTIKADELI